jgi:NTE family protein
VLDRLLEEPDLRIEGISGTSAGAMNAAVLASGYANGGGAKGAKTALETFWRRLAWAAQSAPSAARRSISRWDAGRSTTRRPTSPTI